MAKAMKKLFSQESGSSDHIKGKQIIEKLKEQLKKKLSDPQKAQKAALIIEQWIHESNDRKEKKKSA